ncbi:metal-dependent hydrolase, partial [Micrococcus sp. GbtcB5]|uniref:metal-dependent hydrolase n=1 Tax=Micrococcus sp. GbtcB5 TaxID=2824750 RepID=UPI001C30FBE3
SPIAVLHLPAELQLLGAATTAGAAMISDWDHPRATVVHALPPVSELMARGIRHVAGGHRRGTHSPVGIAAFTAVATGAA